MKIKRHQSGGIVYTPFFRNSNSQTPASNTTENKGDNEIQKAIIVFWMKMVYLTMLIIF